MHNAFPLRPLPRFFLSTLTPSAAKCLTYHSITRPGHSHSDTQIQKQFKSILLNLPSGGEPRKTALRKLQAMSDSWRAKISEKKKRKLHYAMVRCSKIERAVYESLNPRTRETMQIWNHDHHLPQPVAEPTAVGLLFSKCLTLLGGDLCFTVKEDTLNRHLARVPKCPHGTSLKSLPSPDQEWFHRTITAANPAKATGEDDINYYVVSISPLPFDGCFYVQLHTWCPTGLRRNGQPPGCVSFMKKGTPGKRKTTAPFA